MALVTASVNRYRTDLFFRTECNIIALQIAFSLLLIAIVGVIFSYLYYDISNTIVAGIRESLRTNADPLVSGTMILQQLQDLKIHNLLLIVIISTLLTIAFGYIIARVTLFPARNALTSQKQFIGNVAHELRTPLSIIKTNTEVALMDMSVDKRFRLMTKSNIEELDRISHIINNLLTLSAFTQPERMEFVTIDLCLIASEVVKKLSGLADRKHLELTIRKCKNAMIVGNPAALDQIISNLLKNAINFTPERGHVSVTIEARYNTIELTIKDSGVGIARKDLFRIFEPFYRADLSRNRQRGGSGLGLAIVNELVKLHHGKIVMQSAMGQGTTATVLFPKIKYAQEKEGAGERKQLNEIEVDFTHY